MNIQEMHIGLGIGVDKIASLSHDSLQSEEKDYFLNRAIEEFIKQQYSLLREREKSLEAQFVNENLESIIVFGNVTNLSVSPLSEFVLEGELPQDYRFYLSSKTRFAGGEEKVNRLINASLLRDYIPTRSNSSLFRELPLIIQQRKFHVLKDPRDGSVNRLQFIYIKNPQKVSLSQSVNSDLPEHTHKDIVDIAVDMILRDIKVLRPERTQTQQLQPQN